MLPDTFDHKEIYNFKTEKGEVEYVILCHPQDIERMNHLRSIISEDVVSRLRQAAGTATHFEFDIPKSKYDPNKSLELKLKVVESPSEFLPKSIVQTDCDRLIPICAQLSISYSQLDQVEVGVYENHQHRSSRSNYKGKYVVGVLK